MQRIFPLTDGSAIEITTAVYNPPTSPSFDGEGVRPDFEVKMNDDSMPGNLLTDPQLQKAVDSIIATIRMNMTIIDLEPEESGGTASRHVSARRGVRELLGGGAVRRRIVRDGVLRRGVVRRGILRYGGTAGRVRRGLL